MEINSNHMLCTKRNYIEKIQELYLGENYYLRLEQSGLREDYYDSAVDPDGITREHISEREIYLSNNIETVEFIKQTLRNSKVRNILDFGCGLGWLMSVLNSEYNVHGIESSTKAQLYASQFGPVFKTIESLPSVKFDCIIINHVIEHLLDPVKVMQQLTKLLPSGGKLIIGTPDFSSAMAIFFKDRYRMLNEPTHISLFSFDSILRLVRDLGFVVNRVEFPFFNGPYFTKENLEKIKNESQVSPPFHGNYILIAATKK